MAFFFKRLFSTLVFPFSWTILTIVLLCIPGSPEPGDGFWGLDFGFEYTDKVVHVILFGGIVLFWGLYSRYKAMQPAGRQILLFIIFSIALGVTLEYVQLYFIPFRSFDRYDIVADSGGAIAAGIFLFFTKQR